MNEMLFAYLRREMQAAESYNVLLGTEALLFWVSNAAARRRRKIHCSPRVYACVCHKLSEKLFFLGPDSHARASENDTHSIHRIINSYSALSAIKYHLKSPREI